MAAKTLCCVVCNAGSVILSSSRTDEDAASVTDACENSTDWTEADTLNHSTKSVD